MQVTKSTSNHLKIDRQQARRHLDYLGYKSDHAFLRFFHHSDDPRKNTDKGRKLDYIFWEPAAAFQRDGRGVYVVVNGAGSGHEDKDIKQCAAIFCEWDDRPVEDQLQHWRTVNFLEPTFTVFSGDKSAQPYWVFDEPLDDVDLWRELQVLLIEVMEADPANNNLSRVFRLAGGWHVKPGREPVKTEIVADSGKKYSPQFLLEKLREIKQQRQPQVEQPTLQKLSSKPQRTFSQQSTRYEDITLPVPEPVPLELCLCKDSRSLLESGAAQGERNNKGAKLARDLIGTANYLQNIGQKFDGNPWQLFLKYCYCCPTGNGWGEGEWTNIWKSATTDRPTPSCKEDGVNNCIRAWYWNNYLKTSLDIGDRTSASTPINSSKRSGSNSIPPISTVSLRERTLEIIERNYLPSERKTALIELARSTGQPLREVEQLAEAIEFEMGASHWGENIK
jgi:hypothetical protein